MYYLFLDESGDHNLFKINEDFPVFVLAGCIFQSDYYKSVCVQEINSFKEKLFKNSEIILHTADITRNKNGFEELQKENIEKTFIMKLINYLKN